jgi:hypothetical protein
MTSSIAWPRRLFADCSPSTHRTASEMFDLPDPLGPTTTVTPGSSERTVRSAKDLNPLSMRDLRCKEGLSVRDATLAHAVRVGVRTDVILPQERWGRWWPGVGFSQQKPC